MDLSIVIPLYNEEENVQPLHAQLKAALEAVGREYQIIIVDDGSTDGSFEVLKRLHEGDERLKVNIFMEAPHSQHEEETGELVLFEHPMTEALTIPEVSSYPFREEWYQAGVQTFEEVERI